MRDRLATDGFYDDERVRIRSDALMRAYELLYPRDERTLSTKVLSITGQRGLVALWCDRAVIERGGVILKLGRPLGGAPLIREWMSGFGVHGVAWPNQRVYSGVRLPRVEAVKALRLIRPLLHPSMRAPWRDYR